MPLEPVGQATIDVVDGSGGTSETVTVEDGESIEVTTSATAYNNVITRSDTVPVEGRKGVFSPQSFGLPAEVDFEITGVDHYCSNDDINKEVVINGNELSKTSVTDYYVDSLYSLGLEVWNWCYSTNDVSFNYEIRILPDMDSSVETVSTV